MWAVLVPDDADVDASEVRRLAAAALSAAVPTRAGRSAWARAAEQVVWVIELDRGASWAPWALMVGVKINDWQGSFGIWLVNDCDVVIDYAFLGDAVPPDTTQPRFDDHKSYFTMVFDHTHDLITAAERARAFEFMARDLIRIAETLSTAAQVREAVRLDFFRSGFVSRTLRE